MSAAFLALLAALQHPTAAAPQAYAPRIAPASDEYLAAMQSFAKPEGFAVECFAAEPRVAQPVAFWIARDGGVYVAETFRHYAGVFDIRDHMDWLDEDVAARTVEDRVAMFRRHLGERVGDYEVDHERVRLLRDADGDGKADLDTVYADGFNDLAAGIGAGVMERGGKVWFTCIPDLWQLEDRDGDGRADVRRKLSTGWGVRVALLGHDMHGLCVGPDGRLYWSIGDRGFHATTFDGKVLDHPLTGAVLRSDLDGTHVEIFATGLRNPQELCFDDQGELWTGDNNSDGGDSARWVLVVEQGDSGWRQAYQWLVEPDLRGPWNDEQLWKPPFPGQAAYVAPPVADLANGPSGVACYPGTGLPARYDGHFFLCNFSGAPEWSGVYDVAVKPKGSAYEVASCERFVWGPLATDCDFGWKGGLYVSDWVAGWQKTGKGRIWRFYEPASAADPKVAEVEQLVRAGFAQRGVAELVGLLEHADRRVRQEAHLALSARGREAEAALEAVARDAGRGARTRLHALWALGIQAGRGDTQAAQALRAVLADPDAEVRGQAARTLGDWDLAGAAAEIVPLLRDPSPRARRFAATALARLRHAPAVDAVVALLRETGEADPWLRHAATYALWRSAMPERVAALLSDANVDVRVAAVVALRRLRDARLVAALDDAEPRVALEAARAIYDLPLPQGYEALAARVPTCGRQPNALARRALHAAFRLGGDARAAQIARLAADPAAREGLRREALDLLARWEAPPGRDGFHGEWLPIERRAAAFLPGVVRDLGAAGVLDGPDEVARAWARLAAQAGVADVAPALGGVARDARRDAKLRGECLRSLGQLRAPDAADTARALLFDPQPDVRATALSVLQDLAPGEALPLLAGALGASIAERRVAYAGLARLQSAEADALLARELGKLDADLVPRECALDLVQACEKRDVPALKDALAARVERRRADEKLAPWADGLYGGDAERGRDVFRSKAELECLRCHSVAGEGGVVGPALDGVGARRSRLELAEAIADPNRAFAPGYQGTVVFLTEGPPVEGLVVEDTPERIVLRKADGSQQEIARANVEGTKPGLSAMPTNLADHLSRAQMRDLLEFLATLPAAPAGATKQ